ncbi:MAG: hypothetical protein K6L60_05660 [Oceanobacter sp.]
MAKHNAASIRTRTPNGTYGVLNKVHGKATMASTPANDVVHVLRLDQGCTFYGITIHYDAMGSGTGLKVGISYPNPLNNASLVDDDDAFLTVASTSSAGKSVWDGAPFTTEALVEITVTVTGAAATGDVTVIPEYVYRGAA